jgi:DNA-3-methyladenine glycosylase II
MQQIQGTLTPKAPFDFDKTLEFFGHFRPAMGEQKMHDGTLTKAVSINGQIVVFRVQSIGTVDAPELAYILYRDSIISGELHEAVRNRISFFLSLEDDLQAFYALAQEDSAFEPVMQELYGYHQVKFLSPFENAG